MKKLAVTALCLALVAGFASAQQQTQTSVHKRPASTATSPKPSASSQPMNASPRPITAEEVFFYNAAIFGAVGNLATMYGNLFDRATFNQAMANEFSRTQYLQRMQSKVEVELKRVDFSRRFTRTDSSVLGEYSFANHSFPVGGGDRAIRNYRIEAFDGTAVNAGDFSWTLPMSEIEASSFVKNRTAAGGRIDRSVATRITYSILAKKGRQAGVFGAPPSFNIYIHSVEVYSDGSFARKLGILSKRPGIPESDSAPEVIQAARSATKVIGKYRYKAFRPGTNHTGTPVEGTITVTDAGIGLSGEQPDGSAMPREYSFFDAFALESTELWRADWGDTDYWVVWSPFWKYAPSSDLVFANRLERDHFFMDLTQAIQQWKGKYPQFAANQLKIYQGCDRNQGGFVPCPDAIPVAVNGASRKSSGVNSSSDNPAADPAAAAGSATSPTSNMPDRSLAGLLRDIEAGKEVSIHARYNQAVPGCVYMDDVIVRLSKSIFSLENAGPYDFQVSPDKILKFENQSGEASRLHLKVAILNKKRSKETATDYYLYSAGARAAGSAAGCQGSSVSCSDCDDSMNILYALIQRVRGLD